jgi:hypothetical protein
MRQKDQQRYRDEFNAVIDRAIRECSRATGITDLETVYRHVKKIAPMILKRNMVMLADEQVRVAIQKRLKRCTVPAPEAAAAFEQYQAQGAFDFYEIDAFRAMRDRSYISYPSREVPGKIEYVEYQRSHEWQREASIAHLTHGIDADIARRDAEVAADKYLKPLVRQFGDLDAEQLIRLWQAGARASGGEDGTT